MTEMVPDFIWVPDFFGSGGIWFLRNLVPEKFGPREIWSPDENHYTAFLCEYQISKGPNFLGTKKVRGPNEIGTISVVAPLGSVTSILELKTAELT